MPKVLGYIRVSTQDQADSGLGLDAQKRSITAYCDMKRLELADILADEGVSAARPLGRRAAGARLLAELKSARAAGVVMARLDRGWRDTSDCLATIDRWARCGVSLHVVDLGGITLDSQSAAGRFVLTTFAAAGEFERRLCGERITAALESLRVEGRRRSRFAPYGWAFNAGQLVEVPAEQATIAALHALNDGTPNLSDRAAALGLLNRASRPFSRKALANILAREPAISR